MSQTTYSLQQAANRLRVQPATVQYWVRMFADVLRLPADANRGLAITVDQMSLLQRIREEALDNNATLHTIRQSLTHQPSPLPTADDAVLRQLQHEVSMLREEIAFLAEESKELHRMLGFLTQQTLDPRNGHLNTLPSKQERVSHVNGVVSTTTTSTGIPPKNHDTSETHVSILRSDARACNTHHWSPPTLDD